MPSRVLFLTGAPRSSLLEWDPSGLLEHFTAPVARFAHIPASSSKLESYSVTPVELEHASWRSLDFHRQHLTTGFSQVHGIVGEYQGNALFLTFSSPSHASLDIDDSKLQDDVYSEESFLQYYEHSFTVHEEITSSKILLDSSGPHSRLVCMGMSNTNENSFSTTLLSPSSFFGSTTPHRLPIPDGGHICDLKDIPNAKYLESIQPQTATFNLIVGVISIMPFRKIKTRRGSNIGILELVVGDETRSGFRVNFWLPSDLYEADKESDDSSLGKALSGIRPQDILLLRNVAGAYFQGQVYGQSIRKDLTKVHLLFRNRVDRTDVAGCYTFTDLEDRQNAQMQVAKVGRVRNWVLRFVQPVKLTNATKAKVNLLEEVLPLDTQ